MITITDKSKIEEALAKLGKVALDEPGKLVSVEAALDGVASALLDSSMSKHVDEALTLSEVLEMLNRKGAALPARTIDLVREIEDTIDKNEYFDEFEDVDESEIQEKLEIIRESLSQWLGNVKMVGAK